MQAALDELLAKAEDARKVLKRSHRSPAATCLDAEFNSDAVTMSMRFHVANTYARLQEWPTKLSGLNHTHPGETPCSPEVSQQASATPVTTLQVCFLACTSCAACNTGSRDSTRNQSARKIISCSHCAGNMAGISSFASEAGCASSHQNDCMLFIENAPLQPGCTFSRKENTRNSLLQEAPLFEQNTEAGALERILLRASQSTSACDAHSRPAQDKGCLAGVPSRRVPKHHHGRKRVSYSLPLRRKGSSTSPNNCVMGLFDC
jgi:hypothetical protein